MKPLAYGFGTELAAGSSAPRPWHDRFCSGSSFPTPGRNVTRTRRESSHWSAAFRPLQHPRARGSKRPEGRAPQFRPSEAYTRGEKSGLARSSVDYTFEHQNPLRGVFASWSASVRPAPSGEKLPPRRGLGQAMPPSRRTFPRSGGLGGWRCGRFQVESLSLPVRAVYISFRTDSDQQRKHYWLSTSTRRNSVVP